MLLLVRTSLGLGLVVLLDVCRNGKYWAKGVRAGPVLQIVFKATITHFHGDMRTE